jgi:hypothetical protein
VKLFDATTRVTEASYYHATRRGQLIDGLKEQGLLPGSREFATALWAAEDESYRARQRQIARECGLVLDAQTGDMAALAHGRGRPGEPGSNWRVDPATIRNPAVYRRHAEDRQRATAACARAGIPVDEKGFADYRQDWLLRVPRRPAPAAPPAPAPARQVRLPYPDDDKED